ncbi:MAG: HD domain-containing protein [Verrucomicrobia bacterium]|nr:HD domain-containing protein [Verrucomicrobiota bacterium]
MDKQRSNEQRTLNEILEEHLGPYATRSADSRGRVRPIEQDSTRTPFLRDATRILHSREFRRLKNKTQVFLSPENDHVCTRMEHVLHVASIAGVVARCLSLNPDLTEAIALGHDLGHGPFGHSGEKKLNALAGAIGGFVHELHALRVVDRLGGSGKGLNLSWEVRDGIVCHCGERFDQVVQPEAKDYPLESIRRLGPMPSTLEGCVVRMVDRVAYCGRDMEDAITVGLITLDAVPALSREVLGSTNGEIISSLVEDIVQQSRGGNAIALSDRVFEALTALIEFNYRHIYLHPEVEARKDQACYILDQLWGWFMGFVGRSGRCRTITPHERGFDVVRRLCDHIETIGYSAGDPDERIVIDFVASMTDNFALRSFEDLFYPKALA